MTILKMPSWLDLAVHEEHELPLEPGDYKLHARRTLDGDFPEDRRTVYNGIGPVEFVRSKCPF